MKLDWVRLEYIELKKMVPIYMENVSTRGLNRLAKILGNGERLSSHIILEEDREQDHYWLVAGFPEYLAYKEVYETIYS